MCSARRATFGAVAGLSLSLVMGCGTEVSRPGPSDDVTYADNVTIITSESFLRLESIDPTTMSFTYTGSAPSIAPGDIVSGSSTESADGAYLRRVDSIDELGDNALVIRTSQATVDDAVDEGHFQGKILINPPEGTASSKEQVVMQVGGSGEIDISGELLNNELISVDIPSGVVAISAEIDWETDYSPLGGLDFFSITFEGSVDIDFDVVVSATEGGYYEDEVELLRLPPQYFLVGIIAGQVNVILEAGVEVDASVAGSVETGLDSAAVVELGAYYQFGDWSTSFNRSADFNSHGWEWNLEGTVGARVFIRPKVEVLFYYIAGPVFDLEPYLGFEAEFEECSYEWDLTGGLSSHVGIDLGALSLFVPPLPTLELFDVSTTIASEEIECPDGSDCVGGECVPGSSGDPCEGVECDDDEHCVDGDCVGDDAITICHYPPGNPSAPETIMIDPPALDIHLEHGDTLGPCPCEGDTVCDDDNPCTTDECVDGECISTPIDCDDGDLCTDDECVNGECVVTDENCPPDMSSWERTTDFPVAGYQYDPVEYNGYLYVAGGYNGEVFDTVYVAHTNPDGTLGSWMASTPLPEPDQGPGVTVWNGRIYAGLGDTGNLYWAELNPGDGSLGLWQGPVPGAPYQGGRLAVEAYAGYLYSFGTGGGCNISAGVSIAPLNADGAPGQWTQTTSMPEPRQHQSVHFYNGRVYIVGGIRGCGGPLLDTAVSAPVSANGMLGSWRQEASLPHLLWYHTSLLVGDTIFLFGGREVTGSGGDVFEIYSGHIDPEEGVVLQWNDIGHIPGNYPEAMGAAYSPSLGAVYLIGGGASPPGELTAEVWTTGNAVD